MNTKIKKIILVLIILTGCILYEKYTYAISYTQGFIRGVGGSARDEALSVKKVSDGFIVVGNSLSTDAGFTAKGGRDAFIAKMDLNGNQVWINNAWGNKDDYFVSVVETPDGYVAVGNSFSTGASVYYTDGIIVKYDKNGNQLWARNTGSSYPGYLNSVIVVSDGYIAVGSRGYSSYSQGMIIKYNASGTVLWTKYVSGTGYTYLNSVIPVSGGYIAVGESDSTNLTGYTNKGNRDAIIVKFDTSGNQLWVNGVGGSGYDTIRSVVEVSDGYMTVGNTASNDGGFTNTATRSGVLAKFNLSGAPVWWKSIGGPSVTFFETVVAESDGYVVAGTSNANLGFTAKGNQDGIIAKYNLSGNFVAWLAVIGGSENDIINWLDTTSDGYVVAGHSFSSNAGFVKKGDWDGFIAGNVIVPANIPTSLVATGGSTAQGLQITVSWGANGNAAGTIYELETSNDGSTGWTNIYTGTATSYLNTGVATATTKYYRVRAKNSANVYTSYTTNVTGNTLASPNPTRTLTGNGANSETVRLHLSWTAVPGATGYQLCIFDGYQYRYRDIGNVTSWDSNTANIYPTAAQISTWNITDDPFRWSGDGARLASSWNPMYVKANIPPYITYSHYMWVHILAKDSGGRISGTPWAGATFVGGDTPDTVAPNTPTNLTIGAVTGSTISVSATATTDKHITTNFPGSGIPTNGYRYKYGVTEGSWTTGSYTYSGLTPNTQYTMSVQTQDAQGNHSVYSTGVTKYTLALMPTSLTVTNETYFNKIDVNWGTNGNAVGTIYELDVSNDGSTGWTNLYTGTNTSYSHTGLNYNMTRYYRVRAKNAENIYTSYTTVSTGKTTIDVTPPDITISVPSTTHTKTGPVTYTITYNGADTITLANANVTLNTTGTANGTVAVSGTGTTTRTVTISSITGDGTLGISIAAGTASDAAGNTAAAAGPSTIFTVDNTPPTVTISAPSATTTRGGPITYTVTYSGASAVTLANANVTLNTTGTANGTVSVTGTGTTTRTVTISSITGDGTLGISIAAATASDAAGNTALAAGPSTTFTVDNTPPTISIGAPSATTTRGGPITYTVTYSGASAVTLANVNVTLNTTGTANGTVAVTGTGTTTRTVTISSITGDGTLGISIAAATASDAAGNTAAAAGPSTTFTVDNTPPTISIGAPSETTTRGGPITYTVTYSGASAVTLANGNVTLNTTGTATGTVAVSGTGTATRTVTISSITGDGTLGISIAAGTASDAAGNTAAAAGPSTIFTVDNTVPSVVITATPSANPTNANSITYTFTFSEAVTGFDMSDVGVTNGNKVSFNPVTSEVYMLLVNSVADGTQTVSVSAGVCQDAVGNNNTAASRTVTIDRTVPTLNITATPSANPTNASSITYNFTFSEAVTGFTLDDITVLNGTKGTFTATSTSVYTLVVTYVADGEQTVGVLAGVCSDAAGNGNTAASRTVTIDRANPTATITASTSDITNATSITYTIQFTKPVTGFTADDITVTNGEKGIFTAESSTNYTLNVTNTGTTTQTITIPAGVCQDSLGNQNTEITKTISIDTIPPTIIVTPTKRESNTLAISATVSVSDDLGVSAWQYQWADKSVKPSEGWKTGTGQASRTMTDPGIGVWYLHAEALDTAGNYKYVYYGPYIKIPATLDIPNDTIPPTITADIENRAGGTTDIKVNLTVTDNIKVREWKYIWSTLQIKPAAGWITETTSTTKEITQGQLGTWYLYVYAEDLNGNKTEKRYGPYKKEARDMYGPTITVDKTTRALSTSDIPVRMTITDASGVGNYKYQWTTSTLKPSTGWTETTVTGTQTTVTRDTTRTVDGIWYLHIEATDSSTQANKNYKYYGPYARGTAATTNNGFAPGTGPDDRKYFKYYIGLDDEDQMRTLLVAPPAQSGVGVEKNGFTKGRILDSGNKYKDGIYYIDNKGIIQIYRSN